MSNEIKPPDSDADNSEFKNFLDLMAKGFEKAEAATIHFERISGTKHSAAITNLGNCLSLLYRGACCYWGCQQNDHWSERLVGKAVNQAISSFKLYRACYYDESLMLTRGIGEIANLMHLFVYFPEKVTDWKSQNDRDRYNNFKPSKVRQLLENANHLVPIGSDRYSKLCAIGTHPTPTEVPGHYTASGIPILGMIVQPVGAYVALTELAFAVGLVTVAASKLLKLDEAHAREFKDAGIELIRSLGNFTVLNYEDLLREHLERLKNSA